MAKKRNQDTIHEIRFTKYSDGGEHSRDILDEEKTDDNLKLKGLKEEENKGEIGGFSLSFT
ncbi:unnamed protein product [marine sediment metagenome]|uniref:Uncharacterized protein n=1 Tax=marine sediment metagenome TaxID=412755 RepID=X1JN05_9ZZZZ